MVKIGAQRNLPESCLGGSAGSMGADPAFVPLAVAGQMIAGRKTPTRSAFLEIKGDAYRPVAVEGLVASEGEIGIDRFGGGLQALGDDKLAQSGYARGDQYRQGGQCDEQLEQRDAACDRI